MAKRHRPHRGRVTPKGTRPTRRHAVDRGPRSGEKPDLLADIGQMLASDHPVDLLCRASALTEILTERPFDKFSRNDAPTPSKAELISTFLDVDLPETTALLSALAPMVGDELLGARIHRQLALRDHPLPAWLKAIDQVEVTAAWAMSHVLGDGDNVMLGASWPTGHQATALVYVDHNMGTVVKDAFVVPQAIERMVARFRELSESHAGQTRIEPLDPAEARARIDEAISTGEICLPPFETETWPACRPVLEWLVGRLPAGGTGYQRPDWTEQQRQELARDFLASAEGSALAANRDAPDLLDSILWFACDYGPGDPLRWSPTAVEILLTDWLPRKVVAPAGYLAQMPAVLRSFIDYAHRRRSVPLELTIVTQAAVDEFEPEYQAVIRTDRPQGAAALALMAQQLAGGGGGWDEERSSEELMLDHLAAAVGGRDALAAVDDEPLPDEPFGWDGIAADIRPRVAAVLDLADRCCLEMLDVEYRTVCRRLLALAARADPDVFRRRGRDDYSAAAVVWLAGKANDLFTPSGGGVLVKDVLGWFGVNQGSVSQKAATIRKAAGLPGDPRSAYDVRFGTPSLLTSNRRARIIQRRDGDGWPG